MSRLPKRPLVDHATVAEQLRAQPGEWQQVGSYRSAYSAAATAARIEAAYRFPMYGPAGVFEARVESAEDGDSAVYARYVGGPGVTTSELRPVRTRECEAWS